MDPLYHRLAERVNRWRAEDYLSDRFPAIADILAWSRIEESGELRFLRKPQLRALETYWYLRLVVGTPRIPELYRSLYPEKASARLEALAGAHPALQQAALDAGGVDALLERVKTDDDLVRDFKLQALRETLTLAYPSYILALAMGAGKTILMGAIIATEFAMAAEHPEGDFVQNALVFAPGTTIIESLRELAAIPYERILPPRLYKTFAASLKLTFTRDGEKDVPVVAGSLFNVVVTNTEKIRIQKEQIRKSDLGRLFGPGTEDEARRDLANLRLQKIASLPHLAVFSDEAHHTYGQALDTELKKVRRTVDYLAENTSVVCVVNTTGTPFYRKQLLRDVVIWYGLSEGIRDKILKDVAGNILAYDFSDRADAYVSHVVRDFVDTYGDVRLPDGARAKLAMYFPQTDDLRELRPAVDAAVTAAGLGPDVVLVNTSDESLTSAADIDAFRRLNDSASPHRIILLVNKGTEGWNCPSLFACALARRLKTSNNFVLQASTRCLREVPANTRPARIYLSQENFGVLDAQLKETFGEGIDELSQARSESRRERLVLRKRKVPPLVLTRDVTRVVRRGAGGTLELRRPKTGGPATVAVSRYTVAEQEATRRVLHQVGDTLEVVVQAESDDVHAVAHELASRYRLDRLDVQARLRALYPDGEVPRRDLHDLERQIEAQVCVYDIRAEKVEQALALVKEGGFLREKDELGRDVYVTEIVYPKSREQYIVHEAGNISSGWGFGFHYSPYDFDSNPERHFFELILKALDIEPGDVEDVYFTGGITDPAKTDFFVEYRDLKGKWRRYTPDFILRKRAPRGRPKGSGRVYIVEIKREAERHDPVNGEAGAKAAAVRRWEAVNPDRLKYEMIFTNTEALGAGHMKDVMKFAEAREIYLPVKIDRGRIAEFCRKWRIERMWLFGSILTDQFGPGSDVDVLVRFAADENWSLFDIMDAERELAGIVGREVDLVDRRAIERSDNWMRRQAILDSIVPFYGHA